MKSFFLVLIMMLIFLLARASNKRFENPGMPTIPLPCNVNNEISLTLESLSTQDSKRPVFRAVGNLLLEVDDRDKLMKELSDSKATFETHLQRMIERETELRTQYEKVIDSVEK